MNALVIARFTLQEAVSRRLILAGVLLSGAFLALFGFGFWMIYNMDSELSGPLSDAQAQAAFGTIMTVLGLYAVYFLAAFLALFLSVGAVSGDADIKNIAESIYARLDKATASTEMRAASLDEQIDQVLGRELINQQLAERKKKLAEKNA